MSHCPDLLLRLDGNDAEVLREAAYDAGESRCEGAVERLAELLAMGNIGVQEAAETALRRVGGSKAVAAVAPYLRAESAPLRNMAMDILREIGVQSLESVVKLLQDEDPDIRIFVSDILGSTGVVEAVAPLGEAMLKDPEVNVRYQAAVSLGDLALHEGAPYLNKAMQDDEWVQFAVIEALAKIRDDTSVNALAGALEGSSDLVASMIVDALGEMGNAKAVGLLIRHLGADKPTPLSNKIACAVVSILGGKSLSLLNPQDRRKLVDALRVALEDEDTEIQDKAILGLGYVGGEKSAARILDLAAAMEPEQDAGRRKNAVMALAAMGSTKALLDALEPGAPAKTSVAVEAAAELADVEVDLVMMEVFDRHERDQQREIAFALATMATDLGEPAAVFFRKLLDPEVDGHIIKGALAFLGQSKDCCSGEAMFALINHKYDDVKEAALEACVALWDEAMSQRFLPLCQSQEPLDRLMAAYVYGQARDSGRLDCLKDALNDPVPDIRKMAVEALAQVLEGNPDLVHAVSPNLNDEHPAVRLAVVEALGALATPAATDLLLTVLEDEDDWVRIRAMEALAAAGCMESVHRIAAMVAEDAPLVAIKAVESLRDLGGSQAEEAIGRLSEHVDPQVRSAAQNALHAMGAN